MQSLLQGYWAEFLTVALVHLLAVASPGPDFAVMLPDELHVTDEAGEVLPPGKGRGVNKQTPYDSPFPDIGVHFLCQPLEVGSLQGTRPLHPAGFGTDGAPRARRGADALRHRRAGLAVADFPGRTG